MFVRSFVVVIHQRFVVVVVVVVVVKVIKVVVVVVVIVVVLFIITAMKTESNEHPGARAHSEELSLID